MIMIKIHKILERGLYTEYLQIEVPGRTWLHFDRKGANPSHIGIPVPDLSLQSDRLKDIPLLFKRNAKGEEKVAVDAMLSQLIKAPH
jgi:hypothetical protein